MGLATLFQAASESFDLRSEVAQALRRDADVPPLSPSSWIRASGVAYMCAREEVLATQEATVRAGFSDPDLLLTFLHGTALHWAMQNHLLSANGMLRGAWRCRMCGHVTGGLPPEEKAELALLRAAAVPDAERFRALMLKRGSLVDSLLPNPGVCTACGSTQKDLGDENLFEYEEQWFGDVDRRIGGHPDGFLVIPRLPGSGILEIKSIGSHMVYKVKHTPQMEHLIQAHIYMWLTGRQWALIVYWAKGTHGLSSLIPHVVERTEGTIDKVLSLLESVWVGINGGFLPERICNSIHCGRAGKCALAEVCFREANG